MLANTITNGTKESVNESMPIDFSPKTIETLENLGEVKSMALSVFQDLNDGVEGAFKKHNRIMRDPSENKHKNSLRSRQNAQKVLKREGTKLDKLTDHIDERVEEITSSIDNDIQKNSTSYRYAKDFIQLLRQTDSIERRRELVGSLMKKGNREAVASIIDAPEELTGLTEIDRTRYRSAYENAFFSKQVNERDGLRKLKDRANNAKSYLLSTINGDHIYDHKTIDKVESLQA